MIKILQNKKHFVFYTEKKHFSNAFKIIRLFYIFNERFLYLASEFFRQNIFIFSDVVKSYERRLCIFIESTYVYVTFH